MTSASLAVAANGCTLTGTSYGPVDGRPVLYLAGAATGREMSFGEDLLDARGVRLITMDRPGMGGSTPDPDRTVASTADDYRTFLAGVLGEESLPVPVVANSQGGLFGLAAAERGWASVLVLVSAADEVAHPAVRALLPASARMLPDLVAQHPMRARELLGSFTADSLRAMILDGSDPSDRAVYSEPDFARRFTAALEQGFANEGAGYVVDTMAAMAAWPIDLSRISCPVTVLYGALDGTHSPDQGVTLASRIPGARRTLIPDAGGALLWTHPDVVLDATQPSTSAPDARDARAENTFPLR
ncbi:pimeloyl-ACP methyl ester carboxylesterase [Nocardioides albertanoniae]|uniref:Pimeloyl-ACP methyl ester carboxylesterase n=2 Tax=Nocardioides albertanoniae TaxID=1175486 RepID=A0A543A850_9ACTN|nr:pimeloyl-ACP methyl ester carboxylesterase [Nocardioides albertanoniae]